MPHDPHHLDELHTLVTAELLGELTEAQRDRLEQLVLTDPAARRRYTQLIHDAATLRAWAQDHYPANLRATPLDLGDKARGKPSPCRATPPQSAQDRSRKRSRPFSLLRHWQLWAAAAAIVLAIPAFGIFSYIFRDTVTSLGDPVAVLFEVSDDAEFTFDGPGEHDNYLQNGKPVHVGIVDLKYGSLMFRFHSNAEVTVKAPAKFGLNHPKRAFLHHGELSAFCPEEASGFTIGAPGCAVIDLGTRFWMKVDKLGFTDVAVREGRVELRRGDRTLTMVDAGARVDIAADGRVSAPHAIVEPIDDDPAILVAYTFEDDATEIVRNRGAGGRRLDGRRYGGEIVPGRLPGSTALRFDGWRTRVAVDLPESLPAATVAAWVRFDSVDGAVRPVLTSDSPPAENHRTHWQLAPTSRRIAIGTDLGFIQSDGPGDVVELGRWVHLAMVYDGEAQRLTLYQDGRPVGSTATPPGASLSLGPSHLGHWVGVTTDDGHVFPPRWLDGAIDSFTVFSRALSDSQIERLSQAAEPEAADKAAP